MNSAALTTAFFTVALALFSPFARAENSAQVNPNANADFHAQATTITQGSLPFRSPYAGLNSLSANGEFQTSFTATAFMGHSVWKDGAVYLDPEVTAGKGLSQTRGVAGFPNGDSFHVFTTSPELYVARFYIQQVFELGGPEERTEQIEEGPNQLASTVDVRRITVVLGRFSLNDFFDVNDYSHDPRSQFMNWALMDNGAWDYAADTRGYTWGLYAEYNTPRWAIRGATVLEPTEANGPDLDPQIWNAFGDNLEFEYRYAVQAHPGAARFLAYLNRANMGSYSETLANPALGMDITQTRRSRLNYGLGLNLQQEISPTLGAFFRAGWQPGATESWSFTEIDRTLTAGISATGLWKKRANDVLGLAGILNSLSREHADYLGYGGYGFLLGDGKLSYAPEQIAETYYLFDLGYGVAATADFQFVNHPAYNSDRGPAAIFAGRVHCQI